MDDFRDEAGFVGQKAAIVAVGLTGLLIFDKSPWWLLFVALTVYGIASLSWFLVLSYRELQAEIKEEEGEEELNTRPIGISFSPAADRPGVLIRDGIEHRPLTAVSNAIQHND